MTITAWVTTRMGMSSEWLLSQSPLEASQPQVLFGHGQWTCGRSWLEHSSLSLMLILLRWRLTWWKDSTSVSCWSALTNYTLSWFRVWRTARIIDHQFKLFTRIWSTLILNFNSLSKIKEPKIFEFSQIFSTLLTTRLYTILLFFKRFFSPKKWLFKFIKDYCILVFKDLHLFCPRWFDFFSWGFHYKGLWSVSLDGSPTYTWLFLSVRPFVRLCVPTFKTVQMIILKA